MTGADVRRRVRPGAITAVAIGLLVAGACNTLIGPEHQRAYHLPLFKNARLEVVEDAGHTLIGEKPEVALPMFRAFFEGAAAAPL